MSKLNLVEVLHNEILNFVSHQIFQVEALFGFGPLCTHRRQLLLTLGFCLHTSGLSDKLPRQYI